MEEGSEVLRGEDERKEIDKDIKSLKKSIWEETQTRVEEEGKEGRKCREEEMKERGGRKEGLNGKTKGGDKEEN